MVSKSVTLERKFARRAKKLGLALAVVLMS